VKSGLIRGNSPERRATQYGKQLGVRSSSIREAAWSKKQSNTGSGSIWEAAWSEERFNAEKQLGAKNNSK
jgi:hypothetical protein